MYQVSFIFVLGGEARHLLHFVGLALGPQIVCVDDIVPLFLLSNVAVWRLLPRLQAKESAITPRECFALCLESSSIPLGTRLSEEKKNRKFQAASHGWMVWITSQGGKGGGRRGALVRALRCAESGGHPRLPRR